MDNDVTVERQEQLRQLWEFSGSIDEQWQRRRRRRRVAPPNLLLLFFDGLSCHGWHFWSMGEDPMEGVVGVFIFVNLKIDKPTTVINFFIAWVLYVTVKLT